MTHPSRSGPVAGILLAAGTSSRMGRNKLLFQLGGETVVRGAARRAAVAGLDPVIVVLGHEAELVRSELEGLRCSFVVNPNYAEGINGSLHAGLDALPASAAACVVMLADMPFVTTEMIVGLVDAWRGGSAPLAISDYDGVNAPPMCYDRVLFAELRAAHGEGCGRQVVRAHRHEAVVLRRPAAALADLDVPEDVERARALLETA